MSDKKPVKSLEDIEDNLKDPSVPTEEDVLREQLKKESLSTSRPTTSSKPDEEPEEEKSEESESKKPEPEEEDKPVKKAPAEEAEESSGEEDPLDEGEDDPDYMEDVNKDKEKDVNPFEEDKAEEAVKDPAPQDEEVDIASEDPASQTPATHPTQQAATLDDLANESGLEDEGNARETYRDPQTEGGIPHLRSQAGGGQRSSYPSQVPPPPNQRPPIGGDRNPFQSKYYPDRPKRSSKWHLLILALIGVAVIGATIYLLKNQFQGLNLSMFSQTQSPAPSPTAEASVMPSPSPSPTLDRSKYKIRVLNGTTTSGLAASVSGKLKDLGYQIDKTGNADKNTYEETQIKTKSTAEGLAGQLTTDLAPDYQASSSATLKDTDAADAEVIIGTK